jgi:hypothetical protein
MTQTQTTLKQERATLLDARQAHFKRTGHGEVFAGANFVHCWECGAHAHLSGMPEPHGPLMAHNAEYTYYEYIKPAQF